MTQNGDRTFTDHHGVTTVVRNGNQVAQYYPGGTVTEFVRDEVKWVRLDDGREFPYDQWFRGMMNGSIQCGVHPLNLLF